MADGTQPVHGRSQARAAAAAALVGPEGPSLGSPTWGWDGCTSRGEREVPDDLPAARRGPVAARHSIASFPRLATIADREFRYAVSFHGFTEDEDEEERPDILIGGAAPDALKRVMRAVIAYAVAGTGLGVVATSGTRSTAPTKPTSSTGLPRTSTTASRSNSSPRPAPGTIPGSDLPRWEAIAAAVADVYRVILTSSAIL